MLMELHDQLAVGSPLIALLLIQPKNVQPCGICSEDRHIRTGLSRCGVPGPDHPISAASHIRRSKGGGCMVVVDLVELMGVDIHDCRVACGAPCGVVQCGTTVGLIEADKNADVVLVPCRSLCTLP